MRSSLVWGEKSILNWIAAQEVKVCLRIKMEDEIQFSLG